MHAAVTDAAGISDHHEDLWGFLSSQHEDHRPRVTPMSHSTQLSSCVSWGTEEVGSNHMYVNKCRMTRIANSIPLRRI